MLRGCPKKEVRSQRRKGVVHYGQGELLKCRRPNLCCKKPSEFSKIVIVAQTKERVEAVRTSFMDGPLAEMVNKLMFKYFDLPKP